MTPDDLKAELTRTADWLDAAADEWDRLGLARTVTLAVRARMQRLSRQARERAEEIRAAVRTPAETE
jgi:muramoyltetrapeptide carboxypeptidase LdcA involved in peptidoglycan recycling